jgi:hypothetical protein
VKEDEMGGVCGMKEAKRNIYRALVGKPEGKNNLVDLEVDERIILKWNRMAGHRLDLCHCGKGQVMGTFECSNESSSSINVEGLLD